MKKLFTLFGMIAIFALGLQEVKAQDFSGVLKAARTLSNAQSDTVLVTIPLSRSAITFKYDIAKTSGAVAGTIVTQYAVTTDATEQWFTANTYTLTDATATTAVSFALNPALRWRVITATTGTQVSVHKKYLLYRQ